MSAKFTPAERDVDEDLVVRRLRRRQLDRTKYLRTAESVIWTALTLLTLPVVGASRRAAGRASTTVVPRPTTSGQRERRRGRWVAACW